MNSFDWDFDIIKVYEDDKQDLILEGVATVDTADSTNEIVEFNSVKKSMDDFMKKNPIMCLHHDINKPMGKYLDYKPIKEGNIQKLLVKGIVPYIENAEPYYSQARQHIKLGILKSFSVRAKSGRRWVEKVAGKFVKFVSVGRMLEISIVSAGMHGDALFNVVSKSIGPLKGDNMDDLTEIQKSFDSKISELESKLSNQETKFDSKLDTIIKHLNIPDKEEEEFQKSVDMAVMKSLKSNKEFESIQKAMSNIGEEGQGGNPTKADEIKKQIADFNPEHWDATALAEYDKLGKALAEVE